MNKQLTFRRFIGFSLAFVLLLGTLAIQAISMDPPELVIQGQSIVVNEGNDLPVFTGPGPSFYRSASGKAAISSSQHVKVYGRVGNYLLVEYSTKLRGEDISRFAYAPVINVANGESFDELKFSAIPITIGYLATLVDAPSTLRSGFGTIEIDRRNATALAMIRDEAGNVWIYFQSKGFSSVNNVHLDVRGFVLSRYVTFN
ncbi:MAG: hypothetical protein GX836_08450 [Spirochaetales bacterium]|nr:hypothetical protein [Spirochaetales bacterium]